MYLYYKGKNYRNILKKKTIHINITNAVEYRKKKV